MYVIYDTKDRFVLVTFSQWEADFWASLGYSIADANYCHVLCKH